MHVTGNTFTGMFQAVFFEANTGPSTISGNDFTGLAAADNGCGNVPPGCGGRRNPNGVFLLADGPANSSNQAITGNKFHDYAGYPITVNSIGVGASFSDIDITANDLKAQGAHDVTGLDPNGVHLSSRAGGAITGVNIIGNDIAMTSGPSRAGIFVGESLGNPAGPGITSGVVAHFNRIVGSSTNGVQNDAATTVDATDNWWGCNGGPNASGCSKTGGSGGAINATPWLVLGETASPASVAQNQSSTVAASLTKDSNGSTPSSNTFPSGVPIVFGTDLGAVSPASVTTTGPVASSVFSSATAGTASVTATLDNATVSTPVVVTGVTTPPTTTPPGNPTIAFATPANGATLTPLTNARVTLNVTAPAGLREVTLTFNGRRVCSFTVAPFSCRFKPTRGDAGRRGTLIAVVTDAAGHDATANRAVVVGGPATLGSNTGRASHGRARVSIQCADFGPCAGRLVLRSRVRQRGGGPLTTVGSTAFNLPRGRSARVTVALSGRAQRLLDLKRYLGTRATIRTGRISITRNLVLHQAHAG
jgi:hypothetical protein